MSSNRLIVGIDIVRSGGQVLKDYIYAIALVKNSNVIKVEEGNLSRLIRILWEYRPSILALDNIYELGGNSRNVVKVLKLLPPEIDIVQVTLSEGRFTSINELISKAGLSITHKLDPAKTAIVIALLAERGFGEKLKLYDSKVKIIVSKGRGGYAGGSRSDKYQRNMRAAVTRIVKKIKEELEKRGIDYDLTIRKSMGGIERALFIVYTERKNLYGVISKLKGHDVKVIIKPVISRKFIDLSSRNNSRRYLIVGYDPGIESGLAIIDLDGNPLLITSGRELDRSEVISIVSKLGIAALVTTDKVPIPDTVKKLAAMLNAQLFTLPHSLSTAEKELIVKEYSERYGIHVKNTHERDSLAAAIKAYKVFEQKMLKLQEKINQMGLRVSNIQKYKLKLIKNEPLSKIIEEIIMENIERKTQSKNEVKSNVIKELISEALSRKDEIKDKERKIRQLSHRIDELEKENNLLRAKIRELESKLHDYEYKFNILNAEIDKSLIRDRKINELTQRLRNTEKYLEELRVENERLKELLSKVSKILSEVINGNAYMVRSLKPSELSKLSYGEVLFLNLHQGVRCEELGEVISKLKKFNALVLLPQGLSKLSECLKLKHLIPAKPLNEEPLLTGDKVIIIKHKELEHLMKVKEEVEEIKKELESKDKLTLDKLKELINAYRINRVKELMSKSEVK